MASPPSSSNNPAPSPLLPSLSLPKKRPPTGPPPINTSNTGTTGNDSMRHKRRKPSTASNISLTSHPLRQTSFPPEGVGAAAASPVTSIGPGSAGVRWASRSPSVESTSVAGASVSGVGQKRRRRGGGAARGGSSVSGKKNSVTSAAPSVTGTTAGGDGADARSLVDGRPGSRGGSLIGGGAGAGAGAGDDVDDEDDEAGLVDTMMEGGGKMDEASVKQEREHLSMLIDAFDKDQTERYEIWRRVRLKKETVRRLANQTLSQSVPASVVTTINGYTKIFIGELIERARDVQTEWLAAAELARLEKEQQQQQQQQHDKNPLPIATSGGVSITNINNNNNNNDADQSSATNPKTEDPVTTGTTTISLPSSSSSSSPAPPPDPTDTDMTDVNANATDPTTSTDRPPPGDISATNTDTTQQKPLPTAATATATASTMNPTESTSHADSDPDPDPEYPFEHQHQHQHNHDHDHNPDPNPNHPSINLNLHNHIQTLIRPPLTPDHLREALRRYKKDRQGGAAGFQGLSLQGRERVAVRMGGRRLFK